MQKVPVFYACDENFVPYTLVSVSSLVQSSSQNNNYEIHVLSTGISEQKKSLFWQLERSNVKILFDDVSHDVKDFESKLPIRDYYTKTTYFRFFIAEKFPQFDQVVYLDSDTVVLCDVAELWRTDLGDNYVGAVNDALVPQTPSFAAYVEEALGIYRYAYFNAGVMVIDCDKFRKNNIMQKFQKLLGEYNFAVAQDQDYLNVLCKDRVLFVDKTWNVEAFADYPAQIEPKLVHFNMTEKPWHYRNCKFEQYFWHYVESLPVRDIIEAELANYTDSQRERDCEVMNRLFASAQKEAENENSYHKCELKKCDAERVNILHKISLLEQSGKFDVDVENDPPTLPLTGNVDYLQKRLSSKINRKIAFTLARAYVARLIRKKQLIVKVEGLDNLENVDSAVVTCNHIHPFDSFVMQYAFMRAKKRKRLFRVIREGNYTSFPGLYGYFMRHCDTLPLSSSLNTMKKFSKSVDELLGEGQFVLIYPEQSMWWNYRKPRPMKIGAFKIAARNNVPVLPCFITMRDTEYVGDDGFPVQEYTVHIGEPITPIHFWERTQCGARASELCSENHAFWKDVYESVYGMPLHYDEAAE